MNAPRLLGAAVLIASAALSTAAAQVESDPIVIEGIAAVVNDSIILSRELDARVALLVTAGAGKAGDDSVRKLALDALIEDMLVGQAARAVGLTVTDEEVTAAIAQIMQANGINEEQLRVALAEQGFTPAAYRNSIRDELIRYRMISYVVRPAIQITDQHVKEAYEHLRITKGDGIAPLADLQETIRSQLYEEATINGTQQWLDQLRREAYIQVR